MSLLYAAFNFREFEVHQIVYNLIPHGSKVLDLGCATGYFGKELAKKRCEVFGIEKDKKAARLATSIYKKVVVADLDGPLHVNIPSKYFNVVLLLDVIEHLINREILLRTIRRWLRHNGCVILSTPNIAHLSIRLKFIMGDFTYTEVGILDKTHLHFFTRKTLINFLKNQHYKIESLIPSADFGQIPFWGKILKHLPKNLQFKITKLAPTLLATQFIVVCRPD